MQFIPIRKLRHKPNGLVVVGWDGAWRALIQWDDVDGRWYHHHEDGLSFEPIAYYPVPDPPEDSSEL